MHRLARDLDAREQAPGIFAGEFVMIAGDENDAGAVIDFGENLRHHAALRFRPIPAALELPAVYDVAHQKQGAALVVGEEIGQGFTLAAARAQMRVGDEDGAVTAQRPDRRQASPPHGGETLTANFTGAFEPGPPRCGCLQKGSGHHRSPPFSSGYGGFDVRTLAK